MRTLSNKTDEQHRLIWMDVLRGLLILCVVIGHATGRFNSYIYQFHMGAFFFLSGYMVRQEKRTLLHTVYHRLLTTFLPVISATVLLSVVVDLMNAVGAYSLFFPTELPYRTPLNRLPELVLHGRNYIWWLGATWFIVVLFGAAIVSRVVFQVCGKRSNILYLLISLALFLLGYSAAQGGSHDWDWDLMLIAQFYYALGAIAGDRELLDKLGRRQGIGFVGFLTTGGVLYLVASRAALTTDWPSRRFNSPAVDVLLVCNGLLFVFFLASLIKNAPGVQQTLSFLGRNTLPIVLFHFMWFNLGFYLLYLLGKTPLSTMQCFSPPNELGGYWWMFVLVGCGCSVLLWKLIVRCTPLRIAFGQEKELYNRGYAALSSKAGFHRIDEALEMKLNLLRPYCCKSLRGAWEAVKRRRFFLLVFGIFLLAVTIPWYREGIMCNDELQTRYWSNLGFFDALKTIFQVHVEKGRALAAPVNALTMYLGFIGQSAYSYKIVQILVIFLNVGAFSILLYRLFSSKTFSLFCGLSLIAFLPISFEHTAPNAFTALYGIPLLGLFCSMTLFWDWLEKKGRGRVVGAMVLFLIAACSYEAFIMYAPVYFLLAFYKCGFRESLRRWKDLLWPLGTSVMYLATYLTARKFFPTDYVGNSLVLPNPVNALKIVFQLVRSSFPGYYLTNPKYIYLTKLYQDISVSDAALILLACGAFAAILFVLLHRRAQYGSQALGRRNGGWIIVFTLVIVALPTIPISMAEMYQTTIGGNGFLALPVSYFSFFPATFLCCYLIWQICGRLKKAKTWLAVWLLVLCAMIPIQIMNGEFAARHDGNFRRLETIEAFIKTSIVENAGSATVYAPDLYQTRDALMIHDGYWTDYAQNAGMDVQIVNQEGTVSDTRFYFDDNCFYVWSGEELCVLSKEPMSDIGSVQYLSDVFLAADYSTAYRDGDWYCCYLSWDGRALVPSSWESFAAAQARLSVGQTLDSCVKERGYFADGWLEKESSFQIRSGDEGILHVELYQPKEENQFMGGVITVNSTAQDFSLSGEVTVLDIPVESDTILNVSIVMEQDFPAGGSDGRHLSVLLSDMSCS